MTNNIDCKKRYNQYISVAIIVLLAASTVYFRTQYREQVKVIEHQAHYINELKTTIAENKNNTGYDDITAHLDKLFNSTFSSLKHHFADMENVTAKLLDNNAFNYHYDSLYQYVSIKHTDGEYIIKVALPGISKEKVSLELSGNSLKISTKTVNPNISTDDSNDNAEGNNQQQAKESTQSVRILGDIDRDNIKADLNNGLLTVILRHTDNGIAKEAKTIPVN